MSLKERIMQLRSVPVGLFVLFTIEFILDMILTIPCAYAAYADAFKAQFNMTQTEANILESSMTSPMLFMLPAGLIYNAYGNTMVVIIGLLMVAFGWTSLWLCVLLRHHLLHNLYIVGVAMAIAGQSRNYGYMFVMTDMPKLVDLPYVPIVLAAIDIADEIGTFFISLIYETYYINGHYDDAENQSLEGFMLFVVIVMWISSLMMAVMLVAGPKYHRQEDRKIEEHGDVDLSEFSFTSREDANIFDRQVEANGTIYSSTPTHDSFDKPIATPLSRPVNASEGLNGLPSNHDASESTSIATSSTQPLMPDDRRDNTKFPASYLLILTCTAVPISILYFESQNITYLSRSLSFVYLDYYFITFSRVCTMSGKLLMCLILALGKNHRYIYEISMMIITLLLLTFQLLFLLKGTNVFVFFASFIVSSMIQGTEALLLPLIINAYHPYDFAFKFSFAWSLICVLQAVIQVIYGRLYDSEIPSGGGEYCYGDHCLANTFIMITCCCVLALLAACTLLYMKINAERRLPRPKTFGNSE